MGKVIIHIYNLKKYGQGPKQSREDGIRLRKLENSVWIAVDDEWRAESGGPGVRSYPHHSLDDPYYRLGPGAVHWFFFPSSPFFFFEQAQSETFKNLKLKKKKFLKKIRMDRG